MFRTRSKVRLVRAVSAFHVFSTRFGVAVEFAFLDIL